MRPLWDDYFIKISQEVATRSTCIRRQIGAVAVKDKRILCTGYNGAPSNTKHCLDIGCMRDELKIKSGTMHEKCRAVHAEQNLIVQAALHGVELKGCTVYVTAQPCSICMKMIVGIKPERIIYTGEYPDEETVNILKQLARKTMGGNGKFTEWLFFNWN